jgi:hypothetical protein
MPVCIAGAPRSGISLVSKLLSECGLHLGQAGDPGSLGTGDTDVVPEDSRFGELNEDILSALGGGWDCPPSGPAKWNEDQELRRLRSQAQLLLREFSGVEPWGWKDPCTSLTLPFWEMLLPDIKVVICLRNPLEVALSLHRYNSASYAHGLSLWKIYNESLLESSTPERRIITHYDAYFQDADGESGRLLTFLSMPSPRERIEACSSVVSPGLRHHRLTKQHLLDAGVASDLVDLYARMCAEAGPVRERSGDASRSGDEAEAGENSSAALRVGRLQKAVLEVELLREELRRSSEEVDVLEYEIAARDTTIRALEGALNARGRNLLAQAGVPKTIEELQAALAAAKASRAWRLAHWFRQTFRLSKS